MLIVPTVPAIADTCRPTLRITRPPQQQRSEGEGFSIQTRRQVERDSHLKFREASQHSEKHDNKQVFAAEDYMGCFANGKGARCVGRDGRYLEMQKLKYAWAPLRSAKLERYINPNLRVFI